MFCVCVCVLGNVLDRVSALTCVSLVHVCVCVLHMAGLRSEMRLLHDRLAK